MTHAITRDAVRSLRTITQSDFAPILVAGLGDGETLGHLLSDGYVNTTVVDASNNVIKAGQESFADYGIIVRWLCSDLENAPLKPNRFALWLDGLLFDGLQTEEEQLSYLRFMESRLRGDGVAVIATRVNIHQLISANPEFTLEFEEVDTNTYEQIGLIHKANPDHMLWALRKTTESV